MIDAELERMVFDENPALPAFVPHAAYSRRGDCIEFLISDESFRAERLDSLVTVYYGRETRDIVGSLIKGVSGYVREILESKPALQIEITGSRIRLHHLFWMRAIQTTDERAKRTYQLLRERAEELDVAAELAGADA